MQFKAKTMVKSRRFLRMAIMGPTGSGKTYTALVIARYITDGPVLVIDTERSSAQLYSEELNSDGRIQVIDELPDFTPVTYTRALEYCASIGIKCVIIDSLSHAWQGTKDEVDRVAKKSQSGNSWAAWREVTPQHNQLVDTMLRFPGHVIACLRVKTEWVTEVVNGKTTPKKIGLDPEQKDGIEYEFDFAAMMDQENNFIVTKTRASQFRGFSENRPGMALAEKLRLWCESGIEDNNSQLKDPVKAWQSIFGTDGANTKASDELKCVYKNTVESETRNYSQFILDSYNNGVRGIEAIAKLIGELPGKESVAEDSTTTTTQTVNATGVGQVGTPSVQNTSDKSVANFKLTKRETKLLVDVCTERKLDVTKVLQSAWDEGRQTYDQLINFAKQMEPEEQPALIK